MLTLRIGEVVWVPVPIFLPIRPGSGELYKVGEMPQIGVVESLPKHPSQPFTIRLRGREVTTAFLNEMRPAVESDAQTILKYLQGNGIVIDAAAMRALAKEKGRIANEKDDDAV